MLKLSTILGTAGLVLILLSFAPQLGVQATDEQPAASPLADAAYGKALFTAKGCASCHSHQSVTTSGDHGYNAGPDLTNYRSDPAFLRRWLRDPQAVKPNTTMPNLDLSDDEIEALIAFLNEDT